MLVVLKALADLTRLRLLAILAKGEFTVQELTGILGMGQSRVSRHLKILADAGILGVERQGTWAYYRLERSMPFVSSLWSALETELSNLAEYDQDMQGVSLVLDRRRQRSRQFFDDHARQWDRLAEQLLALPPYQEHLLANVPVADRILEIGFGTGQLLPLLASKGTQVIGVDQSMSMVEQARQLVAEQGLGNVDLRLGEMNHLPVADGEVGVVVLNMVLHHAAQPSEVLHEIHRVMQSGATLVIADLQKHDKEWVRDRLADQWFGFAIEELQGWLEQAGFTVQETFPLGNEGQGLSVFLLTAKNK